MAKGAGAEGGPGVWTAGRRGARRALWAGAAVAMLAAPAAAGMELTELADCRWAIEEVIWRHRIWPESNPGPKPALAEVLPRETVERRMDDALRQVTALAEDWNVRLDGAALQRELDRMARNTKDPAMLRELFAAAGSGERAALCLALPELAKSRLSSLYAEDPEIHRPLREQAEAALASMAVLEGLADHGAEVYETRFVRLDDAATGLSLSGEVELDGEQWSSQVAGLAKAFVALDGRALLGAEPARPGWIERASGLPVGRRSLLVETPEAFVAHEVREASDERLVVATATWRKAPVDVWWEERRERLPRAAVAAGEVALPEIESSACVDDTWTPTAVDYLPTRRAGHAAVWTGTEMLVWGGYDLAAVLGDGARYSPATDTWLPLPATGAPSPRWLASAAWTGQQMLIWGGAASGGGDPLGTGARFTPLGETWSPLAAGPAARYEHVAVWTGSQLVVWGGVGVNFTVLDDGSVYTPATNLWQAMAATGRPSPRFRTNGVWTGTQMIVWGGQYSAGGFRSDGKLFTPGAPGGGTWETMAAPAGFSARALHSAIWTGAPANRMVVWGGLGAGSTVFSDGARFAPAPGGGSWEPMTAAGAPSPRFWHTATWTGEEMVVFGGSSNSSTGVSTGARYDPAANAWTGATSSTGAPPPRYLHSAVWTGEEVIVWGGYHSGAVHDSGGRYDPDLDQWTATKRSRTPAPADRRDFVSVWTGSEMLVWVGRWPAPSGAAYSLATDRWTPLSVTSSPEWANHQRAVWTGSEMIIWGGEGNTALRNGFRYAPGADSWEAISETGAPSPRFLHSAVWSGTEMIVWGGRNELPSSSLDDGGRFDPVGDSWSPLAPVPAGFAPRREHTAVWSDGEMIVWGGSTGASTLLNSGARYFLPPVDAWTEVSSQGAPTARIGHTAVWTGSEMVVWGGNSGLPVLDSGARFSPVFDTWQPTTSTNAPTARYGHTAIWTGSEVVVWGGSANTGGTYFDTGARYAPVADAWQPTALSGAPAPRYGHEAVWAGTRMIVWGGYPDTPTGGVYCALAAEIFQDGFESGGLGAWSGVRL